MGPPLPNLTLDGCPELWFSGKEFLLRRSLWLRGHLGEAPTGGFLHPREDNDC